MKEFIGKEEGDSSEDSQGVRMGDGESGGLGEWESGGMGKWENGGARVGGWEWQNGRVAILPLFLVAVLPFSHSPTLLALIKF